MNEYKLFTQRIGLIGITNLFVGLSGIILLPILTRTFPVEEYGIWVLITVTIGLIPALVMLGLPESMVRFLAAAKKREYSGGLKDLSRFMDEGAVMVEVRGLFGKSEVEGVGFYYKKL